MSSYFALKLLKRKRKLLQKGAKVEIPVAKSEEICRICLNAGTIAIYGNEDSLNLAHLIEIFGDIKLNKRDDNPKRLCDACNNLLQNAIKFRKMAKESEVILLKQLSKFNREEVNAFTYEEENGTYNIGDVEREDSVLLNDSGATKDYCCKLCKLDFSNYTELTTHKKSKEHRKVRIQCQICHRLLTPHMFQRHLAKHYSTTHLICEVCGKTFRKDNLIRHLQLHSNELPYQCKMCPYRGRYVDALKIHMRSHTGDKPYSCDKCELKFLTRSNLNKHILTHNKERPFACKECGRTFYTKRELDIHFNSDHIGAKDFGCNICSNKYGTRKALRRHELTVHKRAKMAPGRKPLYLQLEYKKDPKNNSK